MGGKVFDYPLRAFAFAHWVHSSLTSAYQPSDDRAELHFCANPPSPTDTQTVPPLPTATTTATLSPTEKLLPSPTSSPSTPPTPTPLPVILLKDWRVGNFVEISANCQFPDMQCWQTVAGRDKIKSAGSSGHGHNAGVRAVTQTSQSSLTSRASLLINSAWNNPHLVYWYDNQINGVISVLAKVDNETQASIWETLVSHSFTGQSALNQKWYVEAVDLNRYKGQKVLISINAEIKVPPNKFGTLPLAIDKWHLQKILILPDYHPGMEYELGSVASGQTSITSPAISSTQNLTGTGSTDPFLLTEWKLLNLSVLSTGCKFPDLTCWMSSIKRTEDYARSGGILMNARSNKMLVESQSSLISKSSLIIDPTWSNPQLVFWYDDPFPGDLLVTANVDLKWTTLAHFPLSGHGSGVWQTVAIDLSQFKGKNIQLSISAAFKIPKTTLQNNTSAGANRWHIQNIQLFPNFPVTP